MYIYYNPENTNQIMAMYSNIPTTNVWEQQGFILAEVPDEWLPDQDKACIIENDEVISLIDKPRPPLPPEPKSNLELAFEELEGKKYTELTEEEKTTALGFLLMKARIIDENESIKTNLE